MWFTLRKSAKIVGTLVLVLGLSLVICAASYGQEGVEFFKGKVLEFYCPYKPGGGFDTYSRTIVNYLPKYLPVKAAIVKNVLGAGGLVGTNQLYTAPADGLTIGITNTPAMVINQVVGVKGVQFDIAKFIWLGRVVAGRHVVVVGKNSPFYTIDDLQQADRTIVFSATGKGSDDYLGAAIVAEALGFSLRQVTGYDTTAEANLPVIKGDVDGTELSLATAWPLVKSGDFRPILQILPERSPLLPGVPTALEVVPENKRGMIVALTGIFNSGRTIAGPPGIPKERAQLLKEAINKVLHDDNFVQELKKRGRPVIPLSGEKVEGLIKDCMATAKDIKPILEKIIGEK